MTANSSPNSSLKPQSLSLELSPELSPFASPFPHSPFLLFSPQSVHDYLPPIIYGLLALTAGLMAIRLPETLGKKLPDTIQEGEAVPLEPCFGCGKAAGRGGEDSEDDGAELEPLE